MKRAWRISESARTRLHRYYPCSSIQGLHIRSFTVTRPISDYLTSTSTSDSTSVCVTHSPTSRKLKSLVKLFIKKFSYTENDTLEMRDRVSDVRRDLLSNGNDPDEIGRVLDQAGHHLFRSYQKGSAFIDLLQQLSSSPDVALEVLNWRRKQADKGFPLTSEEYTKGISIAGSSKNIDLAIELFWDASSYQIKTTSTYNALLSAFMKTGQVHRCQEVFRDLKRDSLCSPSIVTYNILISVFGRSMLVDHMEMAYEEIQASVLSPNVGTYNNLIDGYIISFMWGRMERVFQILKTGPVKTNVRTYLLMLRGYAHWGKLEKMEEMYELVKYHESKEVVLLIRHMIIAYCKSSVDDKLSKILPLMQQLEEDEYRCWLNVWLIRVCAEENLFEEMEKYIEEAFEHQTCVNTLKVMKLISGMYYRWSVVDKFVKFIQRAETGGWRICRSIYHSKMIMYSLENRLKEMESVLVEMEKLKLDPTKKTFVILWKAYSSHGQMYKLKQVMGLMCTCGYRVPLM